jgi:hypothetical protein
MTAAFDLSAQSLRFEAVSHLKLASNDSSVFLKMAAAMSDTTKPNKVEPRMLTMNMGAGRKIF